MSTLFAKNDFSRPSLEPVPASSSNASEYASSAQGNKEVYSSSPLSAGSSDTCWGWGCAYSPHRKPFVPAGQGRLRQRYIARRKLVCIFEESTVLRSKRHVSEGNTRRLQRESEDDKTPQRAFFASEEAYREPAESVVYFRSGILCRC